VEQAADPHAQALQKRNPLREPDRGPQGVPVVGVALQGRPAAPREGAQGAGVEVDVAVQERELVAEGLPVGHCLNVPPHPGPAGPDLPAGRGGDISKLPPAAAGWYSARTSVRRGSSWALVSRPHKGAVKSYTGVSCTPGR